jgi:hypothetical protein
MCERHEPCSSRCSRYAPPADYAYAAPAGRSQGGRARRASGTGACSSLGREATLAAHTQAARCWSPAGRCREDKRDARAARSVLVPPSRRIAGGTHTGRHVRAFCRPQPGRADATREPPARARLASIATHRWRHSLAARCLPSACCSRGGQARRASGMKSACLATVATHRWRHTRWPTGVGPCDARAAQRTRLAAVATHCWRRTRGPPGAGPLPAAAGKGRRDARVARARLATVATHRWRHTRGPQGAGPLPAAAGEDKQDARAARERARLAVIVTHHWWYTHRPPGAGLCLPQPGRAGATLERHGAFLSRCSLQHTLWALC